MSSSHACAHHARLAATRERSSTKFSRAVNRSGVHRRATKNEEGSNQRRIDEEEEEEEEEEDALVRLSGSASQRLPFIEPRSFVDPKALRYALQRLRDATDLKSATQAAEWLDRSAGDSTRRMKAAREAAIAFIDARETWSEVPRDLLRRFQATLADTAASKGDIGWLSEEAAQVGFTDATAEFEDILARVVTNRGRLLDSEYVYLLVPGLYASYYPGYYEDVCSHFCALGVDCRISRCVDGEGSVASNADALAYEVEQLYDETKKRVIMIGHSKGGIDSGACVALHDERMMHFVRGIICVQSPFGGSPIATDLLSAPLLDGVGSLLEALLSAPKGEGARLMEPIQDLTYVARRKFLADHKIPSRYPVVSMCTGTSSAAAALYPSALYIRNRYGAESDGLVARCDACIPGSLFVAPAFENDHADSVFPSSALDEALRQRHREEQSSALALRQSLGFTRFDRKGPEIPPPIGSAIVAAQRSLCDVLPERLATSPKSIDYHEALVGLLLQTPRSSQ
jgi:hypothetical protein